MKKIIRDFILLFTLCFLYMIFSKTINVSIAEDLIISFGSAAIFSLLIEMMRNLNEEDLNLKTDLLPKEVEKIRQIRFIVRDSIVTFLLCYGSMTVSLAENVLTFSTAIPFIISALAPALVVGAISKEIRIPSNRQESQVELELKKLA